MGSQIRRRLTHQPLVSISMASSGGKQSNTIFLPTTVMAGAWEDCQNRLREGCIRFSVQACTAYETSRLLNTLFFATLLTDKELHALSTEAYPHPSSTQEMLRLDRRPVRVMVLQLQTGSFQATWGFCPQWNTSGEPGSKHISTL
jgi:hypothetical protein